MANVEKIRKGLECCVRSDATGECPNECPYYDKCWHDEDLSVSLHKDTMELLKDQDEIIDALLKVGYPHNFQRENPWIVNYMWSITDVVKKAMHLRNEELKPDEQNSDIHGSPDVPQF